MSQATTPPPWRAVHPDLPVAASVHIKKTLAARVQTKTNITMLQLTIDQFRLRIVGWKCPTCHIVIVVDEKAAPVARHTNQPCSGRLEPVFAIEGVEWL